MPTERRRIIFSDDEIVSAAISHCKTKGIALPDAEVEDVDIAMESDCRLLLTFAVTSPAQIDEIVLDPDALLNALIAFCRIRSIPIPKSAAKQLEPIEGSLSMVFYMHRTGGSVGKLAPADSALVL